MRGLRLLVDEAAQFLLPWKWILSENSRKVWAVLLGAASVGLVAWLRRKKRKPRRNYSHQRKSANRVNIGAVFGMDAGGSLTKLVYFEPKLSKQQDGHAPMTPSTPSLKRAKSLDHLRTPEHIQAMEELYAFMMSSKTYGQTGVRDDHLAFYSSTLQGRLHFIRFETRVMSGAIEMVEQSTFHDNIQTMGCTGGGAFKFASEFHERLGINVIKWDELDCLVRGLHFALTNMGGECYTYRPAEENQSEKIDSPRSRQKRWAKEHPRKVHIPNETVLQGLFPCLVVSIGSGVSILKVSGPGDYRRVSGSSLGGGTYWGLCRVLTKRQTYDEVLKMAEEGDSEVCDMLVGDIYGGDYDRFQLSSSTVASSFGKMATLDAPESVRGEDIARSLLMMITNNIGQVAYLNAQLHKTNRIFFVGNFLRHNSVSCQRLAYAIDYWSGGEMEALFLEHEGYFGALGAFLSSAFGTEDFTSTDNMPKYADEEPSPLMTRSARSRSTDVVSEASRTYISGRRTMSSDLSSTASLICGPSVDDLHLRAPAIVRHDRVRRPSSAHS